MASEPNWESLLASIRTRYSELLSGSDLRLRRFLNHIENLGLWEAEGLPDASMKAVAASVTFPDSLPIAFATCHPECGATEFIVDGSTQECQRCGRLLFRHRVEEYAIAKRL
jgi:hypothetical protein